MNSVFTHFMEIVYKMKLSPDPNLHTTWRNYQNIYNSMQDVSVFRCLMSPNLLYLIMNSNNLLISSQSNMPKLKLMYFLRSNCSKQKNL